MECQPGHPYDWEGPKVPVQGFGFLPACVEAEMERRADTSYIKDEKRLGSMGRSRALARGEGENWTGSGHRRDRSLGSRQDYARRDERHQQRSGY